MHHLPGAQSIGNGSIWNSLKNASKLHVKRENKLPVTEEQEQAIEVEITQALKQYRFYDQIIKSQMFE